MRSIDPWMRRPGFDRSLDKERFVKAIAFNGHGETVQLCGHWIDLHGLTARATTLGRLRRRILSTRLAVTRLMAKMESFDGMRRRRPMINCRS
jgi:hypothetical protein